VSAEVPDCKDLSLEEKVGQLLNAGCITGGLGSRAEEVRELLSEGLLGGIYTGYPHFSSPYEALEFHERMQRASRYPAFIAGDLENGLAYNIDSECCHFTYLMGLGAAASEELAYQVGKVLGREARYAGFNFHYGPCVDLSLRIDNPITGIRSLGGDPDAVARLGAAYIRGVQSERVICSAKHFPGAGDSAGDTHNVVCALERSEEEIAERELKTFAAAIRAGVKTIMVGHLAVPQIDPSNTVATLSDTILDRLLRKRLGYEGLAITDSMAMGAVESMSPHEMYVRAFKAGQELLLIPNPDEARRELLKAIRAGEISEAEVDRRARRVLELKRWMCRDDFADLRAGARVVFRDPETRRLMRRQARQAVTVATPGFVPLKQGEAALYVIQRRDCTANVFPKEATALEFLAREIERQDPSGCVAYVSRQCNELERDMVLGTLAQTQAEGPVVLFSIVNNYARDPYEGLLSAGMKNLVESLIAKGRQVWLVILGSPYVLEQCPQVKTFICTYGRSTEAVGAAVGVLFGDIEPRGKLPVRLNVPQEPREQAGVE